MTVVFFLIDLPDDQYKCNLSSKKSNNNYPNLLKCDSEIVSDSNAGEVVCKDITANDLVYLIKELQLMQHFHQRVYAFLKQFQKFVNFRIVEPINGNLIDHAWCDRATFITWEKVEIENLMSWLSTLGGAFSALGDSFGSCAERAGRISSYQLKLATKCGDPSIMVRCQLYYSISLIQKGKLRAAKELIRTQYIYAKEERRNGDERLYKMCHGIWLKLQYSYVLRKERRLKALSQR